MEFLVYKLLCVMYVVTGIKVRSECISDSNMLELISLNMEILTG